MEDKHRHRLLADFPGDYRGAPEKGRSVGASGPFSGAPRHETKFLPIEVLHIPDDYPRRGTGAGDRRTWKRPSENTTQDQGHLFQLVAVAWGPLQSN